ncbi:MAG: TRAP transporter small permease subunit [Oscillospiraceae bacterium]|nr:TRAP transporter small permease subunit [Oscillospiraceae bacterium]
MLKKILHGIDKLSESVGKLDSFILIFIIFITFYEVVARYFIGKPTSWSNELSSHGFAIYMTLGGAFVLLKKGHVSMDILSSRFRPRLKALIDILTCFLGISFLMVLTLRGGARAIDAIFTNEHSTSVWGQTMIPFRLCLPVGCALFLLQYVANLVRSLLVLIKGETYIGY